VARRLEPLGIAPVKIGSPFDDGALVMLVPEADVCATGKQSRQDSFSP
jgi:hypothetical protein